MTRCAQARTLLPQATGVPAFSSWMQQKVAAERMCQPCAREMRGPAHCGASHKPRWVPVPRAKPHARHLHRCWVVPGARSALGFTAKGPDLSLGRCFRLGLGSVTVATVEQRRVWGHSRLAEPVTPHRAQPPRARAMPARGPALGMELPTRPSSISHQQQGRTVTPWCPCPAVLWARTRSDKCEASWHLPASPSSSSQGSSSLPME